MARIRIRPHAAPEPNSRLPLAWGDYRGRAVVGVALLVASAALITQTTAATVSMGALGSVLHLAGWLVEPARVRSRALVALPCMVGCWATIIGPQAMWLLAVCLGCWLVVRRRPPVAFLGVVLPLAAALALDVVPTETDKTSAFAVVGAAVAAGAWAARQLALRLRFDAIPMDPIGRLRREGSDAA